MVSLGRPPEGGPYITSRLQSARSFSGREKLRLLRHRQLHREEAIEQPGVEHADREHHEIGAVALDQMEILEQRGQTERDNPRIEAHTDPAERLGTNTLDENLSLIHISEPTRQAEISYAVF